MDPDLIATAIETQAKYEFRLAVIQWFFYGSAVVLAVTVLFLLLEDFFHDN